MPSGYSAPEWDLFQDLSENPEHNLFNSVISEFNDISGFPIEYWSLEASGSDPIYGENQTQEWYGPYKTKLVYKPTSEPQILNAFGITSDDTIEAMRISKQVFSRDTGIDEPKIGDTLKTLWNNKTYEIVYMNSEAKIFQAGKFVWEFICRPFRYDYQSPSADDFLFTDPASADFPDFNITTETSSPEVSGDEILPQYGDNKNIQEESNEIDKYEGLDTTYYGYGYNRGDD